MCVRAFACMPVQVCVWPSSFTGRLCVKKKRGAGALLPLRRKLSMCVGLCGCLHLHARICVFVCVCVSVGAFACVCGRWRLFTLACVGMRFHAQVWFCFHGFACVFPKVRACVCISVSVCGGVLAACAFAYTFPSAFSFAFAFASAFFHWRILFQAGGRPAGRACVRACVRAWACARTSVRVCACVRVCARVCGRVRAHASVCARVRVSLWLRRSLFSSFLSCFSWMVLGIK